MTDPQARKRSALADLAKLSDDERMEMLRVTVEALIPNRPFCLVMPTETEGDFGVQILSNVPPGELPTMLTDAANEVRRALEDGVPADHRNLTSLQ